MALLAVAYMLLRAQYWGNRQIYDGLEYYDDMREFTGSAFDLLKGSADHNSQLWMALAGVANLLFPDNVVIFNLWLSLISLAAVLAVYAIIAQLSAGMLRESEILLAAALVAFHPSILCNLMLFSPDAGLFVAMAFTLLALLKRQRALALVSGCLLVFSKEQGLAYLALIHAFCAYREAGLNGKGRFLLRNWASLLFPYALAAIYGFYKTHIRLQPFFFQNRNIFTGLDTTSLPIYLRMCFELNGSWLMLLVGAAGILGLAFHGGRTAQMRAYLALWPSYAGLLASALLILLLVRHWPNSRYLLAYQFIFLLCFIYVLAGLRRGREWVMLALLGVMALQNFRTIDPVSLNVFCTTQFGARTVLHIYWDHDCVEHPHGGEALLRNQSVYNLEFAHLAAVQEAIIQHYGSDKAYLGSTEYWDMYVPSVHPFDAAPHMMRDHEITNEFYVIEVPEASFGTVSSNIWKNYIEFGNAEAVYDQGYGMFVHHYYKKSFLNSVRKEMSLRFAPKKQVTPLIEQEAPVSR